MNSRLPQEFKNLQSSGKVTPLPSYSNLSEFSMDRDHGESSSYRATIDAPPSDFIEINDSTDFDNMSLMDMFLWGYAAGSAAGADHGQGREEDIVPNDSFFEGLDEVEIVEPISVSPLQMVRMEDPTDSAPSRRTVETDESVHPNRRPNPTLSTLGHSDQEQFPRCG